MLIRPWQNLPTGGHSDVICMGNLGEVYSQENTPEGFTETHKGSFVPYKQVGGRNGDHEWFRIMTNAFILCDLVWKVQKSHAANREVLDKWNMPGFSWLTCICTLAVMETNSASTHAKYIYVHFILLKIWLCGTYM